jgi:heptaprenyl diphosphate synthase
MDRVTDSNGRRKELNKTQMLVLTSLIFATALVLAVVEDMLPPLPIAVPGVKFGLSNIAVMYALFFLGKKQAYTVGILKSVFVFVTRGGIASLLSLTGGLLSITVMIILMAVFRERITYLIISIFGAVFHNVGQFIVISVIYTGMNMWAYFPVLLISGLAAGIVTSTLLRVIMPAFNRLA